MYTLEEIVVQMPSLQRMIDAMALLDMMLAFTCHVLQSPSPYSRPVLVEATEDGRKAPLVIVKVREERYKEREERMGRTKSSSHAALWVVCI